MKYLVLVAIVALFFALWTIFTGKSQPTTDGLLRVALPSKDRLDTYEPTRIHFVYQYCLLQSIYSPLVELSNDKGSPISSIAKKYYWKDDELHFVIRDDLATIDGQPITVDDVIFSLKRLLILSQNTHGDFKNMICPDTDLKSVDEECSRIVKKDNTLILKPKFKWDYLVPMLAAMDFAVIPKGSVDPKTLKIIDYRNTSGPYFVKEDKGGGNIILEANPKHFHFDKNMAEQVVFVPTKGMSREKIIEFFNGGKIDHIAVMHGFSLENLKKIDEDKSVIHETIPIKTEVAFITEKGKKKLSLEKRLAFAKVLQKFFHDHYADREGYKITKQFFLPFGEGGFSKEDEVFLSGKMEPIDTKIIGNGEGISLGVYESKESGLNVFMEVAKTHLPKLETHQAKGIPAFAKLEDKDIPDYMIVNTDSGFLEDISLLSYTMNAGFFGFPQEEGKAWLKDYMGTLERKERIKKLKKMHLESLSQGLMIPIFSTPYISITRKPWEPRLSELFANNPLWKIKRN